MDAPFQGKNILDSGMLSWYILVMGDTMNSEPNSLQEAIVYFSNPVNCLNYLVVRRWPKGIVDCPRCGSTEVYFLPSSPWWKGRLSRSREECSLRARRGQSSLRNGHHTLRSLAFESRRRLAVVARPTRGPRGSPADPEASRGPAAGASPGPS